MTNTHPNKNLAPVSQRIELLDVIRGFALVGILFANILSWSGLKFLPIDVIESFGNFEVDVKIYRLLKFFVDTKFYTIFSLLFGIGFALQISKNRDNPDFPPLYARRLALLLLIGICHALIWSGDILMLYALMGFIMLGIRKVSQKAILQLALVIFAFPLLLDIVYMYSFNHPPSELPKTALKVYPDMLPEAVVAQFKSTDLWTVFKINFHNVLWRWYDFIPSGRPFKILGLFLLGSYLFISGYFNERVKKPMVFLLWMLLGLSFTGLAMTLKGGVSSFSSSWSDIAYKAIHEVGQITLALSYISLLAIIMDKIPRFFGWFVLKSYGRMSLTSYIGQTFLGIIAFYPIIGFAYFGKLSLEHIYYVGAIILATQLLFSMLWFQWFRFGPIEWLWRCATYKKWFPIRK